MPDIFAVLDEITEEFRSRGPRVWVAEAEEICGYHARLKPMEIAEGVREIGSFAWKDAAQFPTANSCRRWIKIRGLSGLFSPTGYPKDAVPS